MEENKSRTKYQACKFYIFNLLTKTLLITW